MLLVSVSLRVTPFVNPTGGIDWPKPIATKVAINIPLIKPIKQLIMQSLITRGRYTMPTAIHVCAIESRDDETRVRICLWLALICTLHCIDSSNTHTVDLQDLVVIRKSCPVECRPRLGRFFGWRLRGKKREEQKAVACACSGRKCQDTLSILRQSRVKEYSTDCKV